MSSKEMLDNSGDAEGSACNPLLSGSWQDLTDCRVYRLRVWIDHEFCVFAADLPGCASQGYDSIDECLANIEEAFRGVVKCYDDDGVDIPWVPGGSRPMFHEERLVAVEFARQRLNSPGRP